MKPYGLTESKRSKDRKAPDKCDLISTGAPARNGCVARNAAARRATRRAIRQAARRSARREICALVAE